MIIKSECYKQMVRMPDKHFDLILTDPPYDYDRLSIRTIHREFLRLSKCVIVFAPPKNQWIEGADQILFWIKPISTKNTAKNYSRFLEMIFVYGRNVWNSDRHWSQYTNIFTDLVDGKLHPHQKPESLISRLILNHTNAGDMVCDPFMGSGTTGVICKKLARRFTGIEIDELYFEIARTRIDQQK